MSGQLPFFTDPVTATQLNQFVLFVDELLRGCLTNDHTLITHNLDPSGGYHDAGPLTETYGGTGLIAYNKGDVIYSDASNNLTTLAIGTIGYALGVNGSGNLAYISIPTIWGDITGTLSNQLDLQAELNGKVNLQATTPGTAQTGHINVSGTLRSTYLFGDGSGITNLVYPLDACGGLQLNASGALGVKLANITLIVNASGLKLGTVDGNNFAIALHRFTASGYIPVPGDFGASGEIIVNEGDARAYMLATSGAVLDIGTAGTSGIIGLTGDVTATGPGSVPATIAAGAVTEAKMTLADNTTWNVNGSGHGFVPKATNNSSGQFLDSCGNWSTVTTAMLSGTLAIASGGTGQTTASGAFNNLSPLTAKGDLLSHTGVVNAVLVIGSSGQALVVNSSAATGMAWTTLALSALTGTLSIAAGGTGQTTASGAFDALSPLTTKGDVLVFNGTDNIRLTAGVDNYILISSSGESAGIKWAQLNFSGVLGTVSVAQGGTGQTTASGAFDALSPLTTKGDIIVHDGTDNIRIAVGSNGQILSVDSSEGAGVKWITSSAGGGITELTGDVTASGTGSVVATIASISSLVVAAALTNANIIPVGTIMDTLMSNLDWYGVPKSPPNGWLWCDGTTYPNAAPYNNLYAVLGGLGSYFGEDPAALTFTVPDLRGRALRMQASASGFTDEIGTPVGAISGSGNEWEHTLSMDELPQHSFTIGAETYNFLATSTTETWYEWLNGSGADKRVPFMQNYHSTDARGGDASGNTKPFSLRGAYLITRKIIKY